MGTKSTLSQSCSSTTKLSTQSRLGPYCASDYPTGMTDYNFSTRAGFQLAMKNALKTSSPEETKTYAEATVTPSFHHVFNGERLGYDACFQSLENWGGKITNYDPKVEEFLRDGDQLATRMTGVVQLGGIETFFESFCFAKVDRESGKLMSLTERAVWGEPEKNEVHATA